MKQFIADRHTSQTPQLVEEPTEVIPIYSNETDLDNDLTNIEENAIVGTDEHEAETNGNQYPVNVIEKGNMHSATSNAVAGAFDSVDITSQVTKNSTYLNTLSVIKTGKTIDVYFQTKNVDMPNATGATGLPKVKSGLYAYGMEVYSSTGSVTHCRVENTALICNCNPNTVGVGHITYVCE